MLVIDLLSHFSILDVSNFIIYTFQKFIKRMNNINKIINPKINKIIDPKI